MQIDYDASADARDALAAIGRTEDIMFSPDGTRLAIAGYEAGRILVLECSVAAEPGGPYRVRLERPLALRSDAFQNPHGLSWIDDEQLIVANRYGQVQVVIVPRHSNAAERFVTPIASLGVGDHIHNPGSIAVRQLHDSLLEVFVCDNFAHTITRHLLDRNEGSTALSSEIVLQKHLKVPDGVAASPTGKWLAVSNHYERCVLVYRMDQIGHTEQPVATLRGMGYPHGVRFTPDDRAVMVADASAPLVHIFGEPSGSWSGNYVPLESITVMDRPAFERGHVSEEEGGPKGIALSPDGELLCVTCEAEPLMLFDLRESLARHGITPGQPAAGPSPAPLEKLFRSRLVATHSDLNDALQRAHVAEARADAAEQKIQALVASSSWKFSAPFRVVSRRLRASLTRK